MTTNYSANEITVLKDLEPVQLRPGMYTDTTRPNHLAQEVIDNSVDEALAGFATKIEVILHKDQSIEVTDNGRGMPVDIHPVEKVSGVEVILSKLHAGGKFSNKNYTFSGGLHGVGISVVNALSERVQPISRPHAQHRHAGRRALGCRHHRRFADYERRPVQPPHDLAQIQSGQALPRRLETSRRRNFLPKPEKRRVAP